MSAVTYAKLGDVAQYLRGINFKPDDVVAVGTAGTVACMRTKNIQESLDCADVWGVAETFVRRPEQILQEGDLLVSSANSWNLVGKCCWIPKLPWKSTFGGFVSALRADPQKIDPRFLYWWFSSDRTQALLRSFGQKTTSISNLNAERCLNLDVPLPAIPEQRRISAILDQADALRTKRREALTQLDSLTQSIFIEMFGDPIANPKGWTLSTVGTLSKLQGGLQVTTARKNLPLELPYLRVANVYRGRLDLTEMKTIQVTDAEMSRTTLIKGDLLIVEGHGNPNEVGRSALWTGEITPCTHQNHIIRVRFDSSKILPIYACEYLNSPTGRRHLTGAGKTTSGLNTINASNVRGTPISVPPISIQHAFAKQFEAVKAIARSHQAAMNESDALFASLQHRAFRGEL